MIDATKFLNPKLFGEDVEKVPIRNGFGEGLLAAGEKNEQVVGLCADLTDSTKMGAFARKFPKRYQQIGVAEQNLASVASGMAAMGKVPFITSYAMFSPGRNWEQIRTTICYNGAHVKVVGSHGGVSVGPDGGTHQAIEDVAIMRVIPRMNVVLPCDTHEARKATEQCVDIPLSFYIRLAREKTPVVTTPDAPFVIGQANLLRNPEKPQVAVIASGPYMVYNALKAAHELAKEGIEVSVLNNHTVKPLDTEAILSVAKSAGKVVTAEEHQLAGGMGSAIAEFLAENYPVPMKFVAVRDEFGQSGTPEQLIEHYGLGAGSIAQAVKELIAR